MNNSILSRRRFIRETLVSGLAMATGGLLLSACGPTEPTTCAPPAGEHPGVGWGPSVFAPVFYGFADYTIASGDVVRMFYPSAESRPSCAQVLGGTAARFPLILFLHGDCTVAANHFTEWTHLPSILARAGFVVAVPRNEPIGHPTNSDSPTYARALAAIDFARNSWSHRHLLFSTITGLIGHSYGALHAQKLAFDMNPTAYVSLSGQQAEFSSGPPKPTCPKMFVWGTGEGPEFGLSDGMFNSFTGEKHKLVLSGLHHWDYAPFSTHTCGTGLVSSCGQYHRIAADLVTIFFSRYMSSEHSGILDDLIPASLELGPHSHTPAQEPFASGYLESLDLIGTFPDCEATLSWSIPFSGGTSTGTRTLPA